MIEDPRLALAEYLSAYLDICERHLAQKININEANNELENLNQTYQDRVAPNALRDYVLSADEDANNDGWVSSMIC